MRGPFFATLLAGLLFAGCEPDVPKRPPVPRKAAPPMKPAVSKSLLIRRLEREGHVLQDGRWFKKENWSWGINNLWEVNGTP